MDFMWPKTNETCKREKIGVFDNGIGLWIEKRKDTFDLNSVYNLNETEFSKKTNGRSAQKDHEKM